MSTPATFSATPYDNFMDRGAIDTPSKSPARRVLGDLTPKAINVCPNNGFEQLEVLKNRSPLKQVQTLSPARQLDTENMPQLQYPGLGRKRPISEVDGAVAREDRLGHTYRAYDERDGSLRQAFRPDVLAKMREDQSTPDADLLEVYDSSEDEGDGSPDCDVNVSQETVGTTGSFSSLINYNPDGPSQNRVSPPPEVPEPSPPQSIVTSQAETLRLRLRMAMYKVRTNQTTVPLAELSLPAPTTTTTTAAASFSTTNPSTSFASSVPSITVSPARSSNLPKLLPAPVLLPTAYSTRFITDPALPSSPPASASPSQLHIQTPGPQGRGFEQLSSPPSSGERTVVGAPDIAVRFNRRYEAGELTSSVVTGRAASGLLELMRAGV